MHWTAIVFGWPFVGASVIAFAFGLLKRRGWSMWLASALAAPFCVAMSANPRFSAFGLLALFSNFGCAAALASGRLQLALVLLVPFVALVTIVGLLVAAP